jgi:hypothetical protein
MLSVLHLRTLEQSVTLCSRVTGSEAALPTSKHRLAVNLTDSEFAELAELATKYGVSLSWLGRKAILDFVERYRSDQLRLPLSPESRRASLANAQEDLAASRLTGGA